MDKNRLLESVTLLKYGSVAEKLQAARDLGNAAGDEKTDISIATDPLIDCLYNNDESLRAIAAMALYNATGSGINLENRVARLRDSVSDQFFGVRCYSVPLLAEIANTGADVSEAIPALTNQLAVENDDQIRTNLALVFYYAAQHGADLTTAIPVLIMTLSIPDSSHIFCINMTDAILEYLSHFPERKEYVRIIFESSSVDKSSNGAEKIAAVI
jgi:hypothetical protein